MYELFATISGTSVAELSASDIFNTRELAYAELGKRFASEMLKVQGNPNMELVMLDTNIRAGFTSYLYSPDKTEWLAIRYEVCAV